MIVVCLFVCLFLSAHRFALYLSQCLALICCLLLYFSDCNDNDIRGIEKQSAIFQHKNYTLQNIGNFNLAECKECVEYKRYLW